MYCVGLQLDITNITKHLGPGRDSKQLTSPPHNKAVGLQYTRFLLYLRVDVLQSILTRPKPRIKMASIMESRHHETLVLLPETSIASFEALKELYGPAIQKSLSDTYEPIRGTPAKAILDIVIATTSSPDIQTQAQLFNHLQHLLATAFKLASLISARCGIELDGPGGVDARVFFLDRSFPENTQTKYRTDTSGPVVRLPTLAQSGRSWTSAYIPDTALGTALLDAVRAAFLERGRPFATAVYRIGTAPGPELTNASTDKPEAGATTETRTAEQSTTTTTMAATQSSGPGRGRQHRSVAVGGTFDHLHIGHKLLLIATALAVENIGVEANTVNSNSATGQRVIIVGITGDELLVNKKYAECLESWEARWRGIWALLASVLDFRSPEQQQQSPSELHRIANPGPNGHAVFIQGLLDLQLRLVCIADAFGPTITDEGIDALVVSAETRAGGRAVNEERGKRGWRPLDVLEVEVLGFGSGEEEAKIENKISSTEIRRRRMEITKGSL